MNVYAGCCVRDNQCTPLNDPGYGNINSEMCIGAGGTSFEESCSALDQCNLGCCIFLNQNDEWGSSFGTSKSSCEIYGLGRFFFDENIQDLTSCRAQVNDAEFNVGFDIRLGTERTTIDSNSFVNDIVRGVECSLESTSGVDYNYYVNCDGNDRLSYGTYRLTIYKEGVEFSRTINVFGDKIHEIVLNLASDETIPVRGFLYQYDREDSGLLTQTDRVIAGATIMVSGTPYQTISDSTGFFELEFPRGERRSISIRAEGFNYWVNHFEGAGTEIPLGDIYLIPVEGSTLAGEFCCPASLGCSVGPPRGSCNTGTMSGPGFFCSGDGVDACKIPALDCCSSSDLCLEPSDGNCANGFACNVPCIVPRTCTTEEISGPCQCDNRIQSSGFCCEVGGKRVHREDGCHGITTVKGLVLGKGRFDTQIRGLADSRVYFSDNENTYFANTDSNGFFEIALIDGTYTSNVFNSAFITPRNSKRLRIQGGVISILTSEFRSSNNAFDDINKVSELVGDNLESRFSGQYNQIYLLDYGVPSCNWEDPETKNLNHFSVSHVLGEQLVRLDWDIDDCLELRGFRIFRRQTLVENERVNSDFTTTEFFEIAVLPPSQRQFDDTNVEWSKYSSSLNGVPVLRHIIEGNKRTLFVNTYETQINWTYEYRIQPIFSMVESEHSQIRQISMGDQACAGRNLQTREFCAYDNQRSQDLYAMDVSRVLNSDRFRFLNRNALLQGLRSLRVRCNDENMLVWTSHNTNRVDCYDESRIFSLGSEPFLYVSPSCHGPDSSGMTSCRSRDECGILDLSQRGSGPFNLLETASSCYGANDARLCVFQPYKSTADKCVYCDEIYDCTYYTSEDSCQRDQCMVGRYDYRTRQTCKWVESAFSSLGEGACVPAVIPPYENYCGLSRRDNFPFTRNAGWSDEFCREFGDCYASVRGGCTSCDDISTCSDYRDEDECVGPPTNQTSISVSYPKPEDSDWEQNKFSCGLIETENLKGYDIYYNLSNDGCGLGVCHWDSQNGGRCIRDANSNREDDEDEIFLSISVDGQFSRDNHNPPVLSVLNNNLLFSNNDGRKTLLLHPHKPLLQDNIDFSENRFGFRYCISREDNCCPNLPSINSEHLVMSTNDLILADGSVRIDVVNSIENLEDGIYYFRYLAQDSLLNVAPLRSFPVIIDTTPPDFSIEYFERFHPEDPSMTGIAFRIISLGKNPETMIEGSEIIKCDLNLEPLRLGAASQIRQIQRVPSSETYLTRHDVEFLVPDGVYNFIATCWDGAGNRHRESLRIRTNKEERIEVISPPDMGAINSFNQVEFEIQTELPSTCSLFAHIDGGVQGPFELVSNDGNFTHKLDPFMGDISDFNSPQEYVFDEVFEFSCYENVLTCSNSLTTCSEDSDCDVGVCDTNTMSQKITFIVDDKPPITTVHPVGRGSLGAEDISYRKKIDDNGISDGIYHYNNNVTISLSCEDSEIDSRYPGFKAGCSDEEAIQYCNENVNLYSSNLCDPFGFEGKVYNGSFTIEHSSVVCFSSVDLLGNREEVRCKHFYISRIPPEINADFVDIFRNQEKSNFFAGTDNPEFRGCINGDGIDKYYINVNPANGYEFKLLDFDSSRSNSLINNRGFVVQPSQGCNAWFSGSYRLTETVNGYGPNIFRIYARDKFGNVATKRLTLFYDTIAPIFRNYRLNGVLDGKEALYGAPINITILLDDVFWTRELEKVTARLYSEQISYLSSSYSYPGDGGTVELISRGARNVEIGEFSLDDQTLNYLENLIFAGYSSEQQISFLDRIASWKEYTFEINPAYGDFTYDIGPGTYVAEIFATDILGQTESKRIVFNVTDANPPKIILDHRHPPVMINEQGEINEKVRVTNRIDQNFIVRTPNAPSICYFNFGFEANQNNLMVSSADRTVHEINFRDLQFNPFDSQPIPFIISCTKHGESFTESDVYTLLFDRRPLRLNAQVSKGVMTQYGQRLVQDHVIHMTLTNRDSFINPLEPTIQITEVSGKLIKCEYECRSSNSRCPLPSRGSFLTGFRPVQTRSFNFNMRSPNGESFAHGDYLYTITCYDQAGNAGTTKDLAISVRTPEFSRQLQFIREDGALLPISDSINYGTEVEFKVATNLLTNCRVNFDQGIDDIILSDGRGSLTHTHSKDFSNLMTDLTSRTFSFKYQCSLSSDPRETLETERIFFTIRTELPKLAADMVQQVLPSGLEEPIPVFKLNNIPEDYSYIEYKVNDGNYIKWFNPDVLIIPEITKGAEISIRAVDSSGRRSNDIIYEVQGVIPLNPTPVEISFVKDGSHFSPSVPVFNDINNPNRFYFYIEETNTASILFKMSNDAGKILNERSNLRPYRNGDLLRIETFPNGFMNEPQGSDYYLTEFSVLVGDNDFFVLFTNENGEYFYSHFTAIRGTEAPEIKSVYPKFIMTGSRAPTQLEIELTKPAYCSVVYRPSSGNQHIRKNSNEFSSRHKFTLDDINRPFNRFEASLVSISCRDGTNPPLEYQHLMYLDSVAPRIIEIKSDNSIVEGSFPNLRFTVVRDEDVHITLRTDEYSICSYRRVGDENWVYFADSFTANLFPRTSIPSTEEYLDYQIRCEDEAGNMATNMPTISVKKDLTSKLRIHDIYPEGIIHDNNPTLEVYTYRPANCRADAVDPARSNEGNIFFRVLSGFFSPSRIMESSVVGHRYRHSLELSSNLDVRTGLQPGVKYVAKITCDPKDISLENDERTITFTYEPNLDQRPRITIIQE